MAAVGFALQAKKTLQRVGLALYVGGRFAKNPIYQEARPWQWLPRDKAVSGITLCLSRGHRHL